MTNEQILDKRWKYTDNKLKVYLTKYHRLNKRTQDKIQNVFNNVDFKYLDLNKNISPLQKSMFLRMVDEWKKSGILKGYFKFKVDELMRKRNITNNELLDIMLYGCFVEERQDLDEYEQVLFTEIGQDLYKQGVDEINPTKRKKWSLTWEYIWALLCLPNIKGNIWFTYVEALALTNSQEIKQLAMITLQQDKKLNINDDSFQRIIKKQQNRYLCVNGDKISGSLDSQSREIANQSFLKAGIDYDKKQIRFISDLCDNTTMMCENMNNYIFDIEAMNEFDRYMGETAKDLRWTRVYVKGLQLGMNLPPISHHFHYCHSTITYQV